MVTSNVIDSGVAYGYDGIGYEVGDRVELHPGTDLWMRGARYGEVVGMSLTTGDRVNVRLDKLPARKYSGPADRFRLIERGCALHREMRTVQEIITRMLSAGEDTHWYEELLAEMEDRNCNC